jgi:hypothetical protein
MRRPIIIAVVVAAAAAAGALWLWRGPSGASRDYGGTFEAMIIPDFPTLAVDRWVNGAPTSLAAQRGNVIIVEAWHPT